MKSRGVLKSITVLILFISSFFILHAQSTGYINRPTTSVITSSGRLVLDPNNDGYTSTTTAGFGSSDVTNSEIPYRSVPSFSTEPFGDLRRGPNHLYSDFVPDINNVGYYAYYDGTNLLFRFRVGSIMPGSKGYSVLLDTDGKFGATGANADPNYQPATTGTNGNPGFEIEIVLETNSRIAIYNVDGSSSATLVKSYVSPTGFWTDMSQISIAGTFDNGDPDFFIDFYIPFSDLTAAPFSLTNTTALRMSATTVMSPQAAIGGPKSDIYGLNDAGYKGTNEQYEAYINAQPSFTASGLASGGFGSMCTSAPTVNSPISAGTVNISGTWTKSNLPGAANAATITVYKDGATILGTVSNVSSGSTWTLNNVSLVNNNVITAKAQASGESMCLTSNGVTAKSCTPATRPALPVLTCSNNYNKGVSGNNLTTGTVVYVENLTRGTVETSATTPAQFTTSGISPNIIWNYAGGCNGGPNMPSGSYRIYYVDVNGCASEPVLFCIASGSGAANNLAGTSITPTITSPVALTPGTSAISGTGEPSSTVRLYVSGELTQTVTATSGGAFSFTNLSLTNGQQIYVTNILNTGTVNTSKCFSTSSLYTVNCYTTPPIITTDNNGQTTAGQPLSGISSEPVGSTIKLYTSVNTLIATTTVQSNGTWSTGNAGTTPSIYNAVAATIYYATAQNGTCGVSAASGNATAAVATSGRCGTINAPNTSSTNPVTGTLAGSVASTLVTLYLDGVSIGTTTTNGTTWSIAANTTANNTLYANGILTIGVREGTNQEQYCAASATTVTCSSGPATPNVSPSISSITEGQTQTYTINNAVVGAFYGIANATTGASLGTGVWATSSTVNLTTTNLTTNSYTVAVKATSLSGISVCSSSPANASLLVSTVLPLNLLDFKAKKGGSGILLEWITENETGAKRFEIERSDDGVTFTRIGERFSKNLRSKTSYTYLDGHPFSINYYRLKMIDEDGSHYYSKVIVVNQNGSFYSAVQPNPFVQSFIVDTYLPSPQPIKIQLLDINGRLIRYKSIAGSTGNNKIEFDDVGNLQPGIYMVRIVRQDSIIEKKIVKGNQ
jgi:hypothetical protein